MQVHREAAGTTSPRHAHREAARTTSPRRAQFDQKRLLFESKLLTFF